MESIRLIPQAVEDRITEMIEVSWNIFLNQFVNDKYVIILEAPFQLHFASVLKSVGELYCLKKDERFHINLEVDMGDIKKNYIDIVIDFSYEGNDKTVKIPIELKFKTLSQSAEDLGVLEIYKDIYSLDQITNGKVKIDSSILIPFSYFFCITNNERYVKEANKGLKTVIKTNHGAVIEKCKEYKYLDTKTGKEFYGKYGAFIFNKQYQFLWQKGNKLTADEQYWFLKMKIV